MRRPALTLGRLAATFAAVLMIATQTMMDAAAQAQSEQALAFEVASVKQVKQGRDDTTFNIMPNGRLVATNVPILLLIRVAHAVQPYQVVDGPSWLESDRYDVQATVPDGVSLSFQTLPAMLRQLLTERFGFQGRRELRQLPLFKLERVRAGGLGPEIEKSSVDCTALLGRPGAQGAAAGTRTSNRFGVMPCTMSTGVGRVTMSGLPMTTLARELSGRAGRVVVDATGLDGVWDLDLQYTPDLGSDVPGAAEAGSSAKPSLFTALQEQLGLRLQGERGPVDVLVVQTVRRPDEN